MNAITFLFYSFSSVLIGSSVAVITVNNPVHAALFLILSFFSAAALWILLSAEFLALTLVLVYVGAVMVLFLFVIMMARFDLEQIKKNLFSNLAVAIPVAAVLIFEMVAVIVFGFSDSSSTNVPIMYSNNTYQIGLRLYTEFFLAFQVAAIILLLAMIAAIAITLRKRKDVKAQNPAEQVSVSASERITFVKVEPKE
ncbi:MAG: NADH:ubiquinone oxidoreductase subunit J [Proteobacteria bacterium]|nr:NADH:ubiquinone oxidoreductase subunit J [Pseudomonadota bacterium]